MKFFYLVELSKLPGRNGDPPFRFFTAFLRCLAILLKYFLLANLNASSGDNTTPAALDAFFIDLIRSRVTSFCAMLIVPTISVW